MSGGNEKKMLGQKGIFLTFMAFLLVSTVLALSISLSQAEIRQERNLVEETVFREVNSVFNSLRQQILVAKEGPASKLYGRFTPFKSFEAGDKWFEIEQTLPVDDYFPENTYDTFNLFAIFVEEAYGKGIRVNAHEPLGDTRWGGPEDFPEVEYIVLPQCMKFSVLRDTTAGDRDDMVAFKKGTQAGNGCEADFNPNDVEEYNIVVHLPNALSQVTCADWFHNGVDDCKTDVGTGHYATITFVCEDASCISGKGFNSQGKKQVIVNLDPVEPGSAQVPVTGTDTVKVEYNPGIDDIMAVKISSSGVLPDPAPWFTARVTFKEDIREINLLPGSFGFSVKRTGFDQCTATSQAACDEPEVVPGPLGSQTNPLPIRNCTKLQEIGDNEEGSLSKHYMLLPELPATTIDCSGIDFTPIGTVGAPFTGGLYGNSNTIENLTIDNSSSDNTGLFGYVDTISSIKDITLSSADVTGTINVGILIGWLESGTVSDVTISSGVVYGEFATGGLIGYLNSGNVIRSNVDNDVYGGDSTGGLVGYKNGGVISLCNNIGDGRIAWGSSAVGGLVGQNYGTITSSSSNSDVEGDWDVGGLVGQNYGPISSSHSSDAEVYGNTENVGGLVGANDNTLTDVWSTADVYDSSGSGSKFGGLVGYNTGHIRSGSASGFVQEPGSYGGGLVGYHVYDEGFSEIDEFSSWTDNGAVEHCIGYVEGDGTWRDECFDFIEPGP